MKTKLMKCFLLLVFLAGSTVVFAAPGTGALCFDVNPEGANCYVENPDDIVGFSFDGKRFYVEALVGVRVWVTFRKTGYLAKTVDYIVSDVFTIYDDLNLQIIPDNACAGENGSFLDFFFDLILGEGIKPSEVRIV